MENNEFHSGFIALIGRPNVGKSTLLNALMGQKIAAVSPKPQTTRRRQLGILTTDNAQLIFVDTPGIHNPIHKLGVVMNEDAQESLQDADVVLWLVDICENPTDEDKLVAKLLSDLRDESHIIIALNKTDLIDKSMQEERSAVYQALVPKGETHLLSATQGIGLNELLEKLIAYMPDDFTYYSEDQITDFYERDIAEDLIREAALLHLRDEVPHSIAVRIDDYKDRDDSSAYIEATIFVERESQKGIVIGKGATMLKQIGTTARKAIENMNGRKVYLKLRVKVNKDWRNSEEAIKRLGYPRT